jgi:hypothetical protein
VTDDYVPDVERWAPDGRVLVPTLYGLRVRVMRYDRDGPTFVELADGTRHVSSDQGVTWRPERDVPCTCPAGGRCRHGGVVAEDRAPVTCEMHGCWWRVPPLEVAWQREIQGEWMPLPRD